jgi:phospholipid/cholesterol/gamma-HCH transport system ATP-binding protein
MDTAVPMIEVKNLNKSFNSHKVLNNLSLQVAKGTTLVVIGRSGCGKSVMLKHIMRILKPESGSIFVDGQDLFALPEKEMNKLRMKMRDRKSVV